LECIFTVICNLVKKPESVDESLEIAKLLSEKIAQQPNEKPALRLILKEWNLGLQDQRKLFLAIANLLKEQKSLMIVAALLMYLMLRKMCAGYSFEMHLIMTYLECIFTVICNLVKKPESVDESLEIAKLLSEKIAQQPNEKPALRLKM
nr:eukaryotic translation initiation factor 3 subunit M-like [Tanacetum cinerariifolium]